MDKFINEQFTKQKLINEIHSLAPFLFCLHKKGVCGLCKTEGWIGTLQLDARSVLEIAKIYSV